MEQIRIETVENLARYQSRTATEILTEDGTVESNCNTITFYNKGTDTVTVLDVPLAQGESLRNASEASVTDLTRYKVAFANAAGATRQLVVIRKILELL